MSKWNYEGEDKDDMFFLTIRNLPTSQIDALPCVKAMKDTFDENVVDRNHMDHSRDALSNRRWFPAVINFGGEMIQVASVYPVDGFFALTCMVLDGEHDADAMRAAVQEVNNRAHS